MSASSETAPESLSSLLSPESIAVIGASDDTSKTGGRALDYLREFAFPGRVYAVNSNKEQVQGHRAYPSADALPEAVDLAIIAVPEAAVSAAVRACAARGVKNAIVTSSGFAEMGDSGRLREEELLASARQYGMRIVGPNSQGIANFASGTVASFSSLFLTYPPADGPVAIVSQSGSMSVVPYCQLHDLGIGVRYCIATGNEADVSCGELLGEILDDPAVQLVLLYMESIADPRALAGAARKAKRRNVPVVALKSGSSRTGQTAALSHTGAMASEDRIVSAFLRRHAIYRASDADELVRASRLYLQADAANGRRLAILTDSGASAVLLCDQAERLGLDVISLPGAMQNELAQVLPSFAATKNPIDMTSVLRARPECFAQVLEVFRKYDVADVFVLAFPASGAGYDVPALAGMAAEFRRHTRKVLAVAVPQPDIAAHFSAVGLATFSSEPQAMLALHQVVSHQELRQAIHEGSEQGEDLDSGASALPALPDSNTRLLDEATALDFIAACGLPVAPYELCRDVASARTAADRFGWPVVMKGVAKEVPHKAALGLVHLNVETSEAVSSTFRQLSRRMRELSLQQRGVLIAKQIAHRIEIAVGAKVDALLGPAMMLAPGGTVVEASNDVALIMVPCRDDEIAAALRQLAAAMPGVSGEAQLAPVAGLVRQLSRVVAENRHALSTLDLNPIVVCDGEAWIVDALIERAS